MEWTWTSTSSFQNFLETAWRKNQCFDSVGKRFDKTEKETKERFDTLGKCLDKMEKETKQDFARLENKFENSLNPVSYAVKLFKHILVASGVVAFLMFLNGLSPTILELADNVKKLVE